MSTYTINVFHDTPMLVGESPLWHPGEQKLYWIDIPNKTVHRRDPMLAEHVSWKLPSEPGCIAFVDNNTLVVAMRSGIALLNTEDGELTPVADAPYDPAKMRFNDGRCDAAGLLWVGTMYEPRDQKLGSLYCLDQGRLQERGSAVTVSNGLAFSPDCRTLYHADTTAHQVIAYDYDLASGRFSSERPFIQFSKDKSNHYGGRPDGAAVDSEGAYWVAMFEGSRILRISASGEVLREIALPVRCPTMIAFGGEELRTLYITTASQNRPEAELATHPLSGCVFSMEVDVPGLAEHAYKM